jgi:hypothetical protein
VDEHHPRWVYRYFLQQATAIARLARARSPSSGRSSRRR